MGKSFSLDKAVEILESRDGCSFCGRTDVCFYFRFQNGKEIALECQKSAPNIPLKDSSVMVWVSKDSVLEDFLHNCSQVWFFDKGKARTKYLGSKVFAKTLSDSFDAVRIQIKKQVHFEQLIEKYSELTPEQQKLHELKIVLKGYPELINESIDLNGTTVLMQAVKSNHLEIVKFLVSQGAHILKANKDGMTAMDFARMLESSHCLEFLQDSLANQPVGLPIEDAEKTAIETPQESDDVSVTNDDILQYILSHPKEVNSSIDENGTTPLIMAVKAHDLDLIKLLLQNGAELDIQDAFGKTALDYLDDDELRSEILSQLIFDDEESIDSNFSNEVVDVADEPSDQTIVVGYQELKGENIFGNLFDDSEDDEINEVTPEVDVSSKEKGYSVCEVISLDDQQRLLMCSELQAMDVSDSVRFVFMGIQTGWKTEEIITLTSEDFLRRNTPLLKALTIYFKDKFK